MHLYLGLWSAFKWLARIVGDQVPEDAFAALEEFESRESDRDAARLALLRYRYCAIGTTLLRVRALPRLTVSDLLLPYACFAGFMRISSTFTRSGWVTA